MIICINILMNNISCTILFDNISGGRFVYVKEIKDISLNDTEGYVIFDGYYYEDNTNLPQKMFSYILSRDDLYEIYEKEERKSTNVVSTIEDEDGTEMNICFFPTNIIKLKFRVIKDYFKHLLFEHK
jgi:hypothetical protein